MSDKLLEVSNLCIESGDTTNPKPILSGFNLAVDRGQRIGVVGESGSGKSLTVAAIMGLLPDGVRAVSGKIEAAAGDMLQMNEKQLRAIRGSVISIVYQNALSSLNPVFPVGRQISDVARAHLDISKADAHKRALELMGLMGIPDAARRALDYPHQFSGGMAQRVAIAMALACKPQLLIADEPTTGLDATIQVQVLDTIDANVQESGSALLLISHDLTVVERMTDELIVLYAGMVLEQGSTAEVMSDPLSPYTKGLVASVQQAGGEISFISGRIPEPGSVPPNSCPFASRCPIVSERCHVERPPLREVRVGRAVACHNVEIS